MSLSRKESARAVMGKFKGFLILFLILFLNNICKGEQIWIHREESKNVKKLCQKCHNRLIKSIESLRYVHNPFKKGECLACHNVHASKRKALLKTEINEICIECHKKFKKIKIKHSALKDKGCINCHSPHGANNIGLLLKSEKKLCIECHKEINKEITKSVIHEPFKEKKCSTCHEVHGLSGEFNLLKEKTQNLCKKCHEVSCKIGKIALNLITKDVDCTECHTGHASEYKGLFKEFSHPGFLNKKCDECHKILAEKEEIKLKEPMNELCFECHEIDIDTKDIHFSKNEACLICHSLHGSRNKMLLKNSLQISYKCLECHKNIDKKISIEEKMLKIRGKPVKERKCYECHLPLHSKYRFYLCKGGTLTCAKCHAREHKITHPLGPKAKDPRTGEDITCITCHSMHSSRAEFMLYYDRKRQLCIQCHKEY